MDQGKYLKINGNREEIFKHSGRNENRQNIKLKIRENLKHIGKQTNNRM
jgi:hypothetical protein